MSFLTYHAGLGQFKFGFKTATKKVKGTDEEFPVVEIGMNGAKWVNIGISLHSRKVIHDGLMPDGAIYISGQGHPVIRRAYRRDADDQSVTLMIIGNYDLGGFSLNHQMKDCPRAGLSWQAILCWVGDDGRSYCGECGVVKPEQSSDRLRSEVHPPTTMPEFTTTFPPSALMVAADDGVALVASGEVSQRNKPRASRHLVVLPLGTGIMLARDSVYTRFSHLREGKIYVLPNAIPR